MGRFEIGLVAKVLVRDFGPHPLTALHAKTSGSCANSAFGTLI